LNIRKKAKLDTGSNVLYYLIKFPSQDSGRVRNRRYSETCAPVKTNRLSREEES
jgi:hypothetical protein